MNRLKFLVLLFGSAALLSLAGGCKGEGGSNDVAKPATPPANDSQLQKGTNPPLKPSTD